MSECRMIRGFARDWIWYCPPKITYEQMIPPKTFDEVLNIEPPCVNKDVFTRCQKIASECVCTDYRPKLWR